MKGSGVIAAIAVAILAGCATATHSVAVAVGPDPYLAVLGGPQGYLQVFSATRERDVVGMEFPYRQRTDYYIYDWKGEKVEHVFDNNKGHFEATPRMVNLPPGTYQVKALAAPGQGGWLRIPVVVDSGRITDIHLNGNWRPPAETRVDELVISPGGYPVGFRAAMPPQS